MNKDKSSKKTVDRFLITELCNAFVAFLFAASAPVAIILSVGLSGGLPETDIISWVFAVFTFNGLLSIAMSASYRQPLVFLWTIPGAILVGSALQSLSFSEIIGAYVMTGILLLFLGLTGWVKKVMDWLPMPIVMGMVAGVFINFGLDWIRAFADDFLLVAAMTFTFFVLTAFPKASKFFPPLIWALLVGSTVIAYQGNTELSDMNLSLTLVVPKVYVPDFSIAAMMELVVPLAVTVIAAQNAQGIMVLKSAGHNPPTNAITSSCGFMSILTALYGGISTCLTGPVNAILVSGGQSKQHWIAAIFLGFFAVLFGMSAPTVTSLLIAAPAAFLSTLAGLAMLRTLQSAFESAFSPPFPLGGLIAFLVTLGGLPLLNIGAPFWGLVFGVLASLLCERIALLNLARIK
ncbi:benzoate/H(+) symporter BenE family transporter [Candidatus Puniceispirillum sp.]|jgi:benzoate membrane transport protein|nr:benzoate/H(+) symporter BenE family transporter [Candidatus Puniceispirillum sp.]